MSEKKTLEELRTTVETKVKAYNDAYQDKRFDESSKLDEEIAEAVNEYTATKRGMVFAELAAAPNPMIAAVKMLVFQTIGIKDITAEGSDIPVRTIVDRDKAIDLEKLHKFVAGGIGADKKWIYLAEKFNMLMTAQKARDLGIDPKTINDSYAMSEIARGFDMGKNPCSNTNLLKTLRTVIAAMLGEEYANKATSHDVAFLVSVYSRKGRKALSVACANHRYMRSYLAEICHRIVEGKTYAVEYKAK